MINKLPLQLTVLAFTGVLVMAASCAQTAPVVGTAAVPAKITLNAPVYTPTTTCSAVNGNSSMFGTALTLKFFDDFNSFNLSTGQWKPHFDGGYDPITNTYLGYDWLTKRTLQGNGELEIYVDPGYKGNGTTALGLSPYKLKNGVLSLVANKTPANMLTSLYGYQYTSGLITSRASFVQQYGYFEVRAKVPSGQGLWPAFWLLPSDKSWPPEIDIMEVLGNNPNLINQTTHWTNTTTPHASSGCKTTITAASTKFHTYGVLWTAQRITYYIDRIPVGDIQAPTGLDKPMYMLLNLAVGGYWPGAPDGTTKFPAEFQIDWVAAYSL